MGNDYCEETGVVNLDRYAYIKMGVCEHCKNDQILEFDIPSGVARFIPHPACMNELIHNGIMTHLGMLQRISRLSKELNGR